MSTQKLINRNIRKLTTVGRGSLSVTLPKDLVAALKWRDRQKVVVKKVRGGVVIRDWRSPSKPKPKAK